MKSPSSSLTYPMAPALANGPATALQSVAWPAPGPLMAGPPPGPSPLLTLADNVLQHRRLFIGLLLAALLVGACYWLLSPPQYRADTLLQIQPRGNRSLTASVLSPLQQDMVASPPGFVQGEMEILRSREILSKAVASTQADLSIEVANRFPLLGPWYARTFGRSGGGSLQDLPLLGGFAWGGETLSVGRMDVPRAGHGQPFTLVWQDPQWSLQDEQGHELAQGRPGETVSFALDAQPARLHVADLQARPGTRFRVVPLDPDAVYEDMQRNLRVEEAGRDSGMVRVSLVDGNPRFAAAFLDAMTTAYLQHDQRVRSSEASRSLSFLQGQLPAVKQELDRAEEALDRYRTSTRTVNIGQETESNLRRIGELERERTELQIRRDQLAQRFTDRHPDAQALKRQLASLNSAMAALQGQLRQAPRQEKDLVRLQRDVQVNTQLYTSLLNNAQELRVAQAGMAGGARLIDAAGVTSMPVRPLPLPVLSVSAGLGLLLALAGVTLACLLRPTVRTAEDLEQHTGLRALAAIPESPGQRALTGRQWFGRRQPRLLALKSPADPAVESLRSLRTSLALQDPDLGCSTVLITAATAQVGKSFVAANLATLIAAAGGRVLLMDLDLRMPRLHAYLGLDRHRDGVAEVLLERCELEQALVRDVVPGLDVLLSGRRTGNPGELLLSAGFPRLLAQLEAQYDDIVIDSAPVLPVGDSLAIARLARTTFLVARSEYSSAREVRDAVTRLEGAGVSVDGLILNAMKRGRLATVPYHAYFRSYAQAAR